MKQLILLTAILLTSAVTFAQDTTTTETCADGAGTVITGAISGHKYCKSNNTMNWWNAHAWCDGLGRGLFDLDDCGCDETRSCQDNKLPICPELKGVYGTSYASYVWTSRGSNESAAYYVSSLLGWVLNGYSLYNDYSSLRGDSTRLWALCK